MKILKEAWIQKAKDPRWQLLPALVFVPLLPLSPEIDSTLVLRHTPWLCVQPSPVDPITAFSTHTLRSHHPKKKK